MTTSTSGNPFLTLDAAGEPICQLKQALVLYLHYAPGPKRARRVYDAYIARFAQHMRVFQPTNWLGPAFQWDAQARARFEHTDLPDLQRHAVWGYGFSNGKSLDPFLFMFHGYRPVTEAGKASFFRFEWPWDFDTETIASFTAELTDLVPFLSGSAGYILSSPPFHLPGYNRMYALARRYWGLEAWNLDESVKCVLTGYKCPSWLTLVGDRLLTRAGANVNIEAVLDLVAWHKNGIVLRSRPRPAFIDRHRVEPYDGEKRIAEALLPLQIQEHAPFGGTLWTPESTRDWLYRFAS